jgi:hypothetical protein
VLLFLKILGAVIVTFVVLIAFLEICVIGAAVVDIKKAVLKMQDKVEWIERMVNNYDCNSSKGC